MQKIIAQHTATGQDIARALGRAGEAGSEGFLYLGLNESIELRGCHDGLLVEQRLRLGARGGLLDVEVHGTIVDLECGDVHLLEDGLLCQILNLAAVGLCLLVEIAFLDRKFLDEGLLIEGPLGMGTMRFGADLDYTVE